MEWQEVLASPYLKDLPFKIELNEWGQIVMTPASNLHGRLQMRIGFLLNDIVRSGEILAESSIATSRGVKVADVAWCSAEFIARHGMTTPYPVAPELCVEIASGSNTRGEIQEKIDLYLAKGAQEVWVCDKKLVVHFYGHQGKLPQSELFPGFPAKIEL
jgi:Uma2 family endonuclease